MHEKGANLALIEARRTVLALHGTKENLSKFATKDYVTSKEAMAILTVLNFREFVAAGIREKAFDGAMYKRVQFSSLTRDWENLKGFILELRKTRNRPSLFQEFQLLAERWLKKPLKVDVH